MAVSIGKIVSPIIVLAALGWWGYNWLATHRANSTIDDGNVEILASNELVKQAAVSYGHLSEEVVMAAFPDNRETIRPEVQRTADLFAKAAAGFRSAAGKSASASEKDIEATFKEYIITQSQATSTMAQSKEVLSRAVLMLLDPKIASRQQLDTEVEPLMLEFQRLHAQSEQLAQRATVIAQQNPSKIKLK